MYYLSAERMAVANQAVQDTFEQTSIAWQAIPHWDTGDPGQTRVRKDITYDPDGKADADGVEPPLPGGSLEIETKTVRFEMTLAQASAPTPDALLAAIMSRTVKLAGTLDDFVLPKLYGHAAKTLDLEKTEKTTKTSDQEKTEKTTKTSDQEKTEKTTPQNIQDKLIFARAYVEDPGYRAPSCLLTNTTGLMALSCMVEGVPEAESVLSAANINSLYRAGKFEEEPSKATTQAGATAESRATTHALSPGEAKIQMLMLGRRQRIAHGCAAEALPGEEPVDLAVSVPPSLEVVGETTKGNIELALRIRFALRIKDVRGLVAIKDT